MDWPCVQHSFFYGNQGWCMHAYVGHQMFCRCYRLARRNIILTIIVWLLEKWLFLFVTLFESFSYEQQNGKHVLIKFKIMKFYKSLILLNRRNYGSTNWKENVVQWSNHIESAIKKKSSNGYAIGVRTYNFCEHFLTLGVQYRLRI